MAEFNSDESLIQDDYDAPPKPKFELHVTITANDHEALDELIQAFARDWYYRTNAFQRDEIDSTDGVTSIRLLHTNPTQTAKQYRAELRQWAERRRVLWATKQQVRTTE